jgi:Tfp pilus assembly protein PilE
MSKLKNNETGFGAIETLLVIALIAVIAAVGVYVYQHKLQPPIKAVYNTQSHDMSLTYTSFSTRPVFTNNNTSQASDTTDLTYINGLINQAKIATAKLTTQYNVATLSSKQLIIRH